MAFLTYHPPGHEPDLTSFTTKAMKGCIAPLLSALPLPPTAVIYVLLAHLAVSVVCRHPCSHIFTLWSQGSAAGLVPQMGTKPRQSVLYQMGNAEQGTATNPSLMLPSSAP